MDQKTKEQMCERLIESNNPVIRGPLNDPVLIKAMIQARLRERKIWKPNLIQRLFGIKYGPKA